MRTLKTAVCLSVLLLLGSCGYHVGAFRSPRMGINRTFCVNMFENTSFYPMAGMQMTSALTDALQSDGSFRMAPRGNSDVTVSGKVVSVVATSLRTNALDSYVSDEVNLTVTVEYQVTENSTGKVLMKGAVQESASCANQIGNVQSARDDAVAWAVRQAADRIVANMSTP